MDPPVPEKFVETSFKRFPGWLVRAHFAPGGWRQPLFSFPPTSRGAATGCRHFGEPNSGAAGRTSLSWASRRQTVPQQSGGSSSDGKRTWSRTFVGCSSPQRRIQSHLTPYNPRSKWKACEISPRTSRRGQERVQHRGHGYGWMAGTWI